MIKKRIGNLELKQSSSFFQLNLEHPNYFIEKYYPNQYYGHEKDFKIDEKDPDFYIDTSVSFKYRIHKSCFKHKENCYSIAEFCYNEKEGCYDFAFIGDRPTDLSKEEIGTFFELIKYGFENLNKN